MTKGIAEREQSAEADRINVVVKTVSGLDICRLQQTGFKWIPISSMQIMLEQLYSFLFGVDEEELAVFLGRDEIETFIVGGVKVFILELKYCIPF